MRLWTLILQVHWQCPFLDVRMSLSQFRCLIVLFVPLPLIRCIMFQTLLIGVRLFILVMKLRQEWRFSFLIVWRVLACNCL